MEICKKPHRYSGWAQLLNCCNEPITLFENWMPANGESADARGQPASPATIRFASQPKVKAASFSDCAKVLTGNWSPRTGSCCTPMDFDQLQTFLEVARHASFSRAAEKRFRTQPAISSQIRALEDEVGAKLFDRSGGKVSLTAAGKSFQKYTQETLDARKAMLTSIAEMEHIPRGAITVGANEGTCLHILPEVFADFKKQYPDVSVNIKSADYAKILESVTDNSVDFGVVSLPVKDNRLTVVLIHRNELVIIAPPHHPLGKMKSASVGDLARYPLVLPKAGHTRDALDDLFRERQLKPNYSMELDSSELLKRFVAAGMGVGFIARSNVQEDVRAGSLATISMADAQLRRDLALVFRKDKALSRAALAFIEIAKKHKSSDVLPPHRK